jgi:hypothetical protein
MKSLKIAAVCVLGMLTFTMVNAKDASNTDTSDLFKAQKRLELEIQQVTKQNKVLESRKTELLQRLNAVKNNLQLSEHQSLNAKDTPKTYAENPRKVQEHQVQLEIREVESQINTLDLKKNELVQGLKAVKNDLLASELQ